MSAESCNAADKTKNEGYVSLQDDGKDGNDDYKAYDIKEKSSKKRKTETDMDWNKSGDSAFVESSDDDTIDIFDDIDNMSVKSLAQETKSKQTRKRGRKKTPKKEKKAKVQRKRKEQAKESYEKVQKPKRQWVSINLNDHSDKYVVEAYNSLQQRHRGSDIKETLYRCLVCNIYKAGSKDMFEKHVEDHVNGMLKCSACPFEASTRFECRTHQLECHGIEGKKHVCYLCGNVTSTKEGFYCHMGSAHDHLHFKCHYCKEKFATTKLRKTHYMEKHPMESKYCDKCGEFQRSMTDREYKVHLTSCTPNITCTECGKLLVNRKNILYEHKKRWHTKVRIYQCHLCSYSAKYKKNLKRHLLVHEGNRPTLFSFVLNVLCL